MLRCSQAGPGTSRGTDSRNFALRCHHYWRSAVRAVAQGCDRVFLLPGHSDAHTRYLLPALQERALLSADDLGMWVVGFIPAFVSAFLCVRWLLRFISQSRLHALCVVPHCLRLRCTCDLALGHRRLDRALMSGRLLYLHGFLSGPASKQSAGSGGPHAGAGPGRRLCLPAIARIAQSRDCARRIAAGARHHGGRLIAGRLYATWLCEQHPDLVTAQSSSIRLSLHTSRWSAIPRPAEEPLHRRAFDFTPAHIAEMQRPGMCLSQSRSDAYWLLAEEGDEMLDYRQAVEKYVHSKQTVLPAGNHTFSRWHDYLDPVIAHFLQATP